MNSTKKNIIFSLLAIICILSEINPQVISETDAFTQYQEFASTFQKKFSSLNDMTAKFGNFQINLAAAQQLNGDPNIDNTATYGVTQFSDMSPQIFQQTMLTLNLNQAQDAITSSANIADSITQSIADKLAAMNAQITAATADGPHRFLATTSPLSWNWSTKGAVTPIKNQGACGSCWTFATTGILEGLYYIKNKVLNVYSEQQILDCDNVDGGCNGGNVGNALNYIKNAGGLQLASTYGKYLAKKNTCTYKSTLAVIKVKSFVFVSTVETSIRDYLYANGPVAIALNANPLQYYTGGIINLSAAYCSQTILNHAVLLVGYGTSNGIDYWIAKNQWGATWGEKGYFRIARGAGVCGMNKLVYSAVLA